MGKFNSLYKQGLFLSEAEGTYEGRSEKLTSEIPVSMAKHNLCKFIVKFSGKNLINFQEYKHLDFNW